MTYYIYHKDEAPEALLAKHPNHATYEGGDLFLFCESHEYVTGTPSLPEDIDDLVGTDADPDFMGEEAVQAMPPTPTQAQAGVARAAARLTAIAEFNTRLQTAITAVSKKEIRVNNSQGKKLYDDWVALQPV